MTTKSKVSPHHAYKTPLLQAMMSLTAGKPNTKIRHTEAVSKACEILGVALDAHGVQAQTGQQWTVRWASLAMIDLKKLGYMDFPIKGWWTLTPEGVAHAETLMGIVRDPPAVQTVTPEVQAAIIAGPDLTDAATVKAVVKAVTKAKVDPTEYLPATVAQVVDSYLLSLQMASTPCFAQSAWSAKAELCKTCPLATPCYGGMIAKMAALAAGLPKTTQERDAVIAKASTPSYPAAMPPAPHVRVTGSTPTTPTTPIQPPKPKGSYVEMDVIAEVKCSHCGKLIPKGTKSAYSRPVGFAHLACVKAQQAGA